MHTIILTIFLAAIPLTKLGTAKEYYRIDENGNKSVTITRNLDHQTKIEAYIKKEQSVDKDGKTLSVADKGKTFIRVLKWDWNPDTTNAIIEGKVL